MIMISHANITAGAGFWANLLPRFRARSSQNSLTYDQLKAIPKIDLHRHLEGSLRLSTLVDIAKAYNLEVPKEIEALRPYVQVIDEPPNAFTFLAKFEMLRQFYRSPEMIKRLVYEVVADADLDNVKYLELRFSPQALSRVRGFALNAVTDWVIESVNQASEDFEIDVRLIVTLVRHNSLEQARQVAELALDRLNRGIVGLDLAGDEINHSAMPFAPIFREAGELGMGITIHAGEWMGAETVREAIESLNAHRIGHGTRTREDASVMSLVRERNVSLEICLTSNVHTASIKKVKEHPLKQFLNANIPVTLNTDDPSVSNISLSHEFNVAVQEARINYNDLRRMTFTAIDTAFLKPEEKLNLRHRFEQYWPEDMTERTVLPAVVPTPQTA